MRQRVHARLHAAVHHRGGDGFDRRRSESYDRLAQRTLRGLYRRVASDVACAAPPRGQVLDVGTGPGRLLHEVAATRSDLSLVGVDPSEDMIALAERVSAERGSAGRTAFRVADVAALAQADNSVDLVVSTLSMHHWPDPEAAAAELARVIRPGGRLMVYDLRFAPVDEAMTALSRHPVFAQEPPVREPVRTGWFPLAVFQLLALSASG